MENRNLALSLLFLAIVVSGCADNGEKVSGDAVTVTGPTIQPSEIFEGSSAQAKIGVENTGKISGQVLVGENGEKIMTDHCPDFFNIEDFQARSSRNSDTINKYDLQPGERIQVNWRLNQSGGNVPLNGYSCPVKFQVPFNYSVQAYQQIQIKQEDTETEVDLSSQTSQGPLSIAIETIGSSSRTGAPVFLERDKPGALIQIVNEQPDNSVFRGVIEVRDLEIGSSGIELGEGCDGISETIKIDRNHMSEIIRCDINGTELNGRPSKRAEITASASYTYVKDIGSRNIKVKYSGN